MKYIFTIVILLGFSSQLAFADTASNEETKKAFAYLDVDCKRKEASESMKASAGDMTMQIMAMLFEMEHQRRVEGKKLDVLLLARGKSTLSKKATLINDRYSYSSMKNAIDRWVEENMDRRDFVRTGSRINNFNVAVKQVSEQILRDEFKEKDATKTLDFTHIGILVRDNSPQAALGWSFIHVLSPCSTNMSRVYNEGIARFFLDRPDDDEYMAWAMVPTDEIQERIFDIVENSRIEGVNEAGSPTLDWSLKPPIYNLVATMERPEEGNSNAFPLYVLAAAIANEPNADYVRANQLAQDLGYKPSRIFISGFYRNLINPSIIIRPFIPDAVNLREEDHPMVEMGYPVIEVNSAQSIRDFMLKNDVLDDERKIEL